MKERIVIAGGWRTPQAKAGGALALEDAGHLGAAICRETLARSGLDPSELDEVIVGCVGPPHDQANLGRVVALRAGVPERVPARTVARNCASGIEAVTSAALSIDAGRGDLFLCAGVVVMSRYPLIYGPEMTRLFDGLSRARSLRRRAQVLARFRPAHLKPVVSLLEGLTDPVCGLIMGRTAEVLAREFSIPREAADRFAVESHQRAEAARDAGRFTREIVPLVPLGAASGARALEHDDGIRDAQTLEGMAKLPPYFEKPDGTVTVGNSCGISDGAAALVVSTRSRARALGLVPLAAIRAWAWAGLDPARMGLGPAFATAKALGEAGCRLADIGVIEINEAFAAQVLACRAAFASKGFAERELSRAEPLGELDPARTNVNGGAIALGHPVGATGARLLLTLAHQMAIADCELGLATLCIGGGQGGAVILERVAA